MEIADTHEHLLDEKERCAQNVDFFRLIGHYALGDAISAGMTRDAVELMENKNASDVERWKALEPYWKFSHLTAYSQCLRTAIRDIYGFDEISAATIRPINDGIRARNQPGLYHYIFKERARIRFWVQDDRAFLPRPHPRGSRLFCDTVQEFDRFVIPQTPDDMHKLEKVTGVSITSLDGAEAGAPKKLRRSRQRRNCWHKDHHRLLARHPLPGSGGTSGSPRFRQPDAGWPSAAAGLPPVC